MNWWGWVDFFKDDNGRKSSTRLTVITGCMVGSGCVAWLAYDGKLTEGMFGLYLAYCAGVYGVMKLSDSSVTKASINSSSPPPITVQNIENAENLTKQGDVNVQRS